MKKDCNKKPKSKKSKIEDMVTAGDLIQYILESGLTMEDIIKEANKYGIKLKFGVSPAEDNEFMNAPTGETSTPVEDPINPAHYKNNSIETIDYLRAISTSEEFEGHCKLTAIKYISRAGKKDGEAAQTDKAKAIWYLQESLRQD